MTSGATSLGARRERSGMRDNLPRISLALTRGTIPAACRSAADLEMGRCNALRLLRPACCKKAAKKKAQRKFAACGMGSAHQGFSDYMLGRPRVSQSAQKGERSAAKGVRIASAIDTDGGAS